jgi:hypothetical protein
MANHHVWEPSEESPVPPKLFGREADLGRSSCCLVCQWLAKNENQNVDDDPRFGENSAFCFLRRFVVKRGVKLKLMKFLRFSAKTAK